MPGKYWAAWTSPIDILCDQATAYLTLGENAQAERLLSSALQVSDKAEGLQLKRLYAKLALVNLRAGRKAEAEGFELRGARIRVEHHALVDPLAETLGFVE